MERGGLERIVCDLAREQIRGGHQVTVVCLFRDGPLADEARTAGAQVVAIGKRAGIDVSAVLRLRRVLKASNASVIHTHNAMAHYYAAFVARPRGRSILVNTRHGMGGSYGGDRREWLFSRALSTTAAVVAVCQAAARRLVEDGIVPSRLVKVVPNGVRVGLFGSTGSENARLQLDVPVDALVVGSVGRLNEAKDHALLLRAFGELIKEIPGALMLIVGDGEERAELERLAAATGINGRVRFLGDRSDVAFLLPAMDIFALSSRNEGYSVALLEASAAGAAIVATDVGGNGEIVQHEVRGLLVKHGDVMSFRHALATLAKSPDLRIQFGSKARAWAAENASVEVMAQRYERLYAGCGAVAESR